MYFLPKLRDGILDPALRQKRKILAAGRLRQRLNRIRLTEVRQFADDRLEIDAGRTIGRVGIRRRRG